MMHQVVLSLLLGSASAFTMTATRPLLRTAVVAHEALADSEEPAPTKRVVMKFGGSSVADSERVAHVAALIASQAKEHNFSPIIVVSAMGKTTNEILNAADLAVTKGIVRVDPIRKIAMDALETLELPPNTSRDVRQLLQDLEGLLDGVSMVRELTPRTRDLVVSYGERMSARVMAAQLTKVHGVNAVAFDSWQIGMATLGGFGDALVDESCYPKLKESLDKIIEAKQIPIVTGFIGHNRDGMVTTLGRGGSDLTATVLGAAAQTDEVQVWKDVDGMMSADPRVVKTAVPVPFVTYDEAAELAYFGAQVLHPISMQPALKTKTPVRVKNSYNPSHPGTLIAAAEVIAKERKAAGDEKVSLVTAITSKRRITLVDIVSMRMLAQHGFLKRVFSVFDKFGISVDVVATSEVSVSLTLDKKQELSADARGALEEIAEVTIHNDRAIVSFIADVTRSTELIAQVFATLARANVDVEMLSQGASKVNVSLVVKDEDAESVVNLLHACFFENKCQVDFGSMEAPKEESSAKAKPALASA